MYQPARSHPQPRRRRVASVRRAYISPKALRILFYLALHPGLAVCATFASVAFIESSGVQEVPSLAPVFGMGMCCFAPVWMLLGFYPAWIMARYLCVPFIKVLRCPRCGFETDAVGIWSSGGYNDYREKHVLLFRNPLDGSRTSHLNCQLCETTILIQERWPLEQWWLP